MKKVILTLSSLLVVIGAYAQGTVNFTGRVVGVYDAPVYVGAVGGPTKADGPAYLVQLYGGASDTTLAAVGTALPFRTGAAAGYWTATAVAIPNVALGANAQVQVKAWAASAGATYEAAAAANGAVGQSTIFTVKTGGDGSPPSLPGTLSGLTSFAIGGGVGPVVPEPSILALGALGGLALLLRRRK
jgi:hypothetical protein